jgi:hypothetical protein
MVGIWVIEFSESEGEMQREGRIVGSVNSSIVLPRGPWSEGYSICGEQNGK